MINKGLIPPKYYANAGAATAAFIKAAPGNVYSVRFTNKNASIRYFQLHNKVTIPLATEAAQVSFEVPGNSVLEIDTKFFAEFERFAAGIGYAISTTDTTFTDSATANEHQTLVRYD